MLELNGRRILDRLLDTLVEVGVDRIVLVIGHGAEDIRRLQGTRHGSTPLHYVVNDIYAATNTIYSLYLARDFLLGDDTLLVEGDLLLEPDIVRLCRDHPSAEVAVVAQLEPGMEGTATQLTDTGLIASFVLGDEIVAVPAAGYFKTVNLYKLSARFGKALIPYLEACMEAHGRTVFYEQAFKAMTVDDAARFAALDITGQPWFEVDTLEDLELARSRIPRASGDRSKPDRD